MIEDKDFPYRVMLEINGKCSRGCKTCLPPARRTGVEMPFEDFRMVARQFAEVGIEEVTLAGFGSPVDHPLFKDFVFLLASRSKMLVIVVCRPDQILRAETADRLIVSVQSERDVEEFRKQFSSRKWFCPPVTTHTLLTAGLANDLPVMLPRLVYHPAVIGINFSCAMVLCGDEGHVAAIRKEQDGYGEALSALAAETEKLPVGLRSRVATQLGNVFPEHCAFHGNMIYIGSDLKVRPCCHQPVAPELGDLRKNSLREILTGWRYEQHVKDWRGSPACRRCPDRGI